MARAQYKTWYGGVMHRWGIFETKGGWEFIPPVDLQAPQLQNTGLKDKNGKEIYEGDVVKFEDGVGAIEWGRQADEACWIMVNDIDVWHLSDYPHRNALEVSMVEVIGNIYENTELIK